MKQKAETETELNSIKTNPNHFCARKLLNDFVQHTERKHWSNRCCSWHIPTKKTITSWYRNAQSFWNIFWTKWGYTQLFDFYYVVSCWFPVSSAFIHTDSDWIDVEILMIRLHTNTDFNFSTYGHFLDCLSFVPIFLPCQIKCERAFNRAGY